MPRYYDISMPLSGRIPHWPGQDGFSRRELQAGEAIVADLACSSHTGTHVDAPKHFIPEAGTIEQIALEKLLGPCVVADFGSVQGFITAHDIASLPQGVTRIIVKTSNTSRNLLDDSEFHEDYVSFDESAAHALVERGVLFVGVDYLSVEAKGSPGHPVHKTLLAAGVVILEGCYIKDVPPGEYNLIALPLKIVDGDGAPTRAILYN